MRDNIYACNARGSLYECNVRETVVCMGWLQLVGSSKLYVSSAEYRLFCRALLHKRRFILWSLLIIATLHAWGGGAYSMAASSTLPTFVFVQKSLSFAKGACQNRALLRKRPIGWRKWQQVAGSLHSLRWLWLVAFSVKEPYNEWLFCRKRHASSFRALFWQASFAKKRYFLQASFAKKNFLQKNFCKKELACLPSSFLQKRPAKTVLFCGRDL